MAHSIVVGDPSLRLKNGYAQDDAIDERRCHYEFKLSHYQNAESVLLQRENVVLTATRLCHPVSIK
jgi:hypothetical protein